MILRFESKGSGLQLRHDDAPWVFVNPVTNDALKFRIVSFVLISGISNSSTLR